jgi:hypothetical protein
VGTDQKIASTDGSTPIKQIASVTTTELDLMFEWQIPQDIQISEPLHRLNLFINGSATPADISAGVIIDSALVNANMNIVTNNMLVKKLGAGSVAGIIIISIILLAATLLSLFFTSRDMFSRPKSSLSPKASSDRSSQSMKLKTLTKTGYTHIVTKSSDDDRFTGKSDAQYGEPARAV